MKEANVKLIERLKGFLGYVLSSSQTKLKVAFNIKDFIRDRKMPFERLVLCLCL